MKQCPTCRGMYVGDPARCPLDGATLASVNNPLLGKKIGEWKILSAIAEGPLSTVYRAESARGSGALKLYHPSAPMLRTERESVALGRVKHPNVAELLDAGTDRELGTYLVTEFIAGKTLREVMTSTRRGMTWKKAAHYAWQIASGLGAIHAANLLHRDLKPENLMVDLSKGGGHLRIVDLGHASLLDLKRLTETGSVWGSAPYMSPEQAAGHPVDARGDLYALGVILYELLTGECPFVAKAAAEVMAMHWTYVPPPPRAKAEMPAALSDVCVWLLAKRPTERPQSARIVEATLEGFLGSQRTIYADV